MAKEEAATRSRGEGGTKSKTRCKEEENLEDEDKKEKLSEECEYDP